MSEAGTEPRAAQPARPRQERIFTLPFVGLMVANGLLRICTYMLITVVPLYALADGVSMSTAGLTTTFYMAAAVVVRPLSGRLVDARGRYTVMLFGSLLYCVATGLYVLTLPVWLLLAVRAVQGLGFSFNGTAVMTLATDLIPENRMSEGIGYLGVEQTVAQLFAPWLALTLVGSYGYQAAFLVVFALAVLNVVVRASLKKAAGRHHPPARTATAPAQTHTAAAAPAPGGPARGPWWSRFVEKNAVRPAAVMFFVMSGVASVNTFMAAYTTGRGVADSGLFFTASGVTLAAARLSGGRLRRTGTTWIITSAITMVAPRSSWRWICRRPSTPGCWAYSPAPKAPDRSSSPPRAWWLPRRRPFSCCARAACSGERPRPSLEQHSAIAREFGAAVRYLPAVWGADEAALLRRLRGAPLPLPRCGL